MRSIPDPGFAGDTGESDPLVSAAMTDVASGAPVRRAIVALQGARLLVPVVAVLDETGYDEPGRTEPDHAPRAAQHKDADLAVVLLTGRDGRLGMLAFTGMSALRRWDPQARPVPVSAVTKAQAALGEGADALVVDVAGPVMVPIAGADLRAVAAGHRLVRVGKHYAWVGGSDQV